MMETMDDSAAGGRARRVRAPAIPRRAALGAAARARRATCLCTAPCGDRTADPTCAQSTLAAARVFRTAAHTHLRVAPVRGALGQQREVVQGLHGTARARTLRRSRRCRRSRTRPARPAATRCSVPHTAHSRANARRRPPLPLYLTGSTLRLTAVLSSHTLETVLSTQSRDCAVNTVSALPTNASVSHAHLRPKRPARQPRRPRPARRTQRGGRRRRERRTRARRAGSCRRCGARHTPQNNIKALVAEHPRHKIDARAAPNPGAPAQP
jgi:hypothetical protein